MVGEYSPSSVRVSWRLWPERPLAYVGRSESASTATGYLSVHAAEQDRLVEEALRP